MAGFFQIVIAYHRRNAQRAREFKFFKACMAAAVIAISDLNACRRESAAVKALVRTLSELRLYDAQHGLDVYENFLEGIEEDAERSKAMALDAIGAVKDDPAWVALLVTICATMSEADGIVLASEVDTIERICAMLEIDSSVAHAVRTEEFADRMRE